MYSRSKQPGWVRLFKQVEVSEEDYAEYGVKKIRFKSYYEQISVGICYERPGRWIQKSWKKHRKTQYK